MTMGNYNRVCLAHIKNKVDERRDFRTLLEFVGKVDLKKYMPLPGDWDHLESKTQQEVNELARKFGVADKWGIKAEC